jgi:hypothetical protein
MWLRRTTSTPPPFIDSPIPGRQFTRRLPKSRQIASASGKLLA